MEILGMFISWENSLTCCPDFMRKYTWDKQLETWVKSTGIMGGRGKIPTVISPEQYKQRFRDAMWRYFVLVPTANTSIVQTSDS
mmetsp:Transcript_28848/g.80666  ORF Transcript_28848/g.80666 Transcript_28848/m.80666 type:complete len:84 (-) Transcript_28848:93-344(-)